MYGGNELNYTNTLKKNQKRNSGKKNKSGQLAVIAIYESCTYFCGMINSRKQK